MNTNAQRLDRMMIRLVALLAGFGLATARTQVAGSIASASASTPAVVIGAAKQCADGHSISAKLGPPDFALIQHFIVCLGKQWAPTPHNLPPSGDGGFGSLGGIPEVASVLDSFASDPKSDATAAFIVSRLDATKVTLGSDTVPLEDFCFSYTYGDTAPPVPSLATITGWIDQAHTRLVKAIGVEANYLRTTAIVQRGAWFHDGSAKNVRFAVVFAGGSPTGHADCSR
ncbi:MAG TPA: hypothetical protein VGP17_14625 [Solirubrobacteraceae bacterium]|jgi:hypothetical protein|nr:hypothetical protein [Solirubrobacteraceae bacterium]